MKLSLLVGGAVGYVLGAKAGRERYDQIVALARRVAGSQTVQATAGVMHAQLDELKQQARGLIDDQINSTNGVNGHHRA
ncbi:MAG: hypothetical protein ACTHMS_22535 [Jatrophihabitans sp.]|uniref:hypothetical protein n=1 Tax=Jatrophihabitans sp. TaxID=1932789 RepID=UPI003F7F250E